MSGLAYLIDALGGFAGGLSNAMQQNQGQNDLGNALSALYGGSSSGGSSSGGGGGLGGLVGMPSSSGQGGQNGAYSYQGQTATNLPSATSGLGTGPLAAQVQTAAQQPGTAQQGAAPLGQGGIGSDQNATPPQSQAPPGGQPPQSAQQPQPNPTAQGVQALGRGPLTLPTLIQAIKQRNPNISGRHLAAAVEKALPILSMEGLQQYRGIAEQLRMQNEQSLIEDRRDRSLDRKQNERDRMQMASDRIFGENQRQQENLKVRLQALQQSKTLAEAKQNASQIRSAIADRRAALKDRLEATNHQIQMQYSLTDDQKQQLYKQAQDDYNKGLDQAKQADDNLDKLLSEKDKGGTEGGKEASPNNKENNSGAQAKPKASDEQKAQWKKQAQDAIAATKPGDPKNRVEWIKNKYKELTGEDLGE